MAALGSQTIAASYEQLLHVDTDGGGSTTTLMPVKDGDNDTIFALQLSSTTVNIDNPTTSSSTQGGILQLQSDDNAALGSGHRLGAIQFYGSEASGGVVDSNVVVGAKIEAFADTGWGASENGTDLVFTTVDGTTATEVMRVHADGIVTITGNLVPEADGTRDLGSASLQWQNVYTEDLNLNNTGRDGNEVDGTTGHWVIQEGDENLFLLNRGTGKQYKFNLEEIV